jgi:4-amino-4-deoxy-L-arabinose transferase-like glycosyltransferase
MTEVMRNVASAPAQADCCVSRSSGRAGWTCAVLVLLLIVYLGAAFSPALMDDADSTHAEAAREMLVRGDYVTLHVNGIRYLEKAPLPYWLTAFSYRIFGINEFATRLPNLLAILLTALLGMAWGRRAFGGRAGIYAGLFVATTVGFYLFTRILIPEAVLSLFLAEAFYFFLTALEERRAWRWYAAYVCIALGVLTKGLIAIIFVGVTVFVYAVLSGEWRRWREFRLGSGILLLLVVAAPWHLLAGWRNPGFFWFYFVNEHFLRFLGRRYPKDYNKLPAALYWSLHLAWLFPWSVYLPVAIKRLALDYRDKLRSRSLLGATPDFAARTQLLCIIWAAIILGFFSFSTNQEYYTFPAYLPIVLLLAGTISAEERASVRCSRWLATLSAITAVVALAAAVALFAGLWSSRHLPYVADIGTVLAQPDLEADTLSMGHMLDLTGPSFAALRLPSILAVIALGVGPLAAFLLRLRRRSWAATWTTGVAMALLLVAAHIALVRFDPFMSSKNLAAAIARRAGPQDQVMIYGDQAFGSSLLFYLRRPILLVNGRTTSMWFGSTFPDAPKIYLDDAALRQHWQSERRVFLFVPQYEQKEVGALELTPQFVIAEGSGKTVLSNQP